MKGRRLHLFDLLAATSIPLPGVPYDMDPVAVVTARDAQAAAVTDAAGRIYVVGGGEAFGTGAAAPREEREVGVGKAATLSPDARTLWWGEGNLLCGMAFAPDSTGRTDREAIRGVEMPSPISAIHAIDEANILLGLEDGRVFEWNRLGGGSVEIGSMDAAIVALGSLQSRTEDPETGAASQLYVAASAGKRLVVRAGGRDPVEHVLRETPIRVVLLNDRPGVVEEGTELSSGPSYRGCSVMVQLEGGGFDIICMPDPTQDHIFAPFSALQGRILPEDDPRRAIAFGGQTRRLAIQERNRLVVRSLLYRPPVGPAAEAAPDVRVEAQERPREELATDTVAG